MLIDIVVGVGLVLTGLILWRKYSKRTYLWFSVLMGATLLINIARYLSQTLLVLSGAQRVVESQVALILRVIVLIAVLIVSVHIVFKKEKQDTTN